MGKKYLIDTNVLLDFMGGKLPAKGHKLIAQIIDNQINLSAINKIELLGFSNVDKDLSDFVDCATIYPIDDDVVNKTIKIRKDNKIKLPDAIIASTALVHGFILVSRNAKDFKNIAKMEFVNPHEL